MTPEIRELLAKLEATENSMTELRDAGNITDAHAKIEEIRNLKAEIEVAKEVARVEAERAAEVAKTAPKTNDKGEIQVTENRKEILNSMEYRTAFVKNLLKQPLNETEQRTITGFAIGNGGGNYVVPTVIRDMIQEVLQQFSPIRRMASVIQSNSNYQIALQSGIPTASWATEANTLSAQNIALAAVTFNAYKLGATAAVSNELINDSIVDIESYVARKLAEAFGIAEGLSFLRGAGTTEPTGMLTGATITQTVATATTLVVAFNDLAKLYTAIKPAYRHNASWLVSNDMFLQLMELKDTYGRPLLMQNVSTDVPYAIFGRPVEVDPNFEATATTKVMGVFGDFKRGYQIVDRTDLAIVASTEALFANDQTMVRGTKRLDGKVLDATALATLTSL